MNFNKDSNVVPLPDAAFLSLEEFLKASLDSTGINYDPSVWHFRPGTNYLYSVSAQYILCYLIEKLSGQTYSEYLHRNIFEPLEMNNTMFYKNDSTAQFAFPKTRKGIENIDLPIWAGERDLIYSTAEDLGKLMIAIMNNGRYKNYQLLSPESIELMQKKHSPGKNLFHLRSNCPFTGYGYGIIQYSNNWFGHGGSTFGYQSLWSFNKSNNKGYVILTNVNGLIYGQKNFDSVWATVSSIEKSIKSEIAPFDFRILYLLIYVSGIIFIIIVLAKRRIRKKHNAT
jgi:CubicO group peptidase (beta-lactamase class C family)